jgi:hypothetical protein
MPSIFHPISLRSGTKYRRLNRHAFSIDEKNWICQQFSTGCAVNSIQNGPSKLYTVFNRRLESFSQRHGLSLVALNEWIDLFHNGNRLEPSQCVSYMKDLPLDAIGLARVETYIKTHPNGWDDKDFVIMFQTQMAQSQTRLQRL